MLFPILKLQYLFHKQTLVCWIFSLLVYNLGSNEWTFYHLIKCLFPQQPILSLYSVMHSSETEVKLSWSISVKLLIFLVLKRYPIKFNKCFIRSSFLITLLNSCVKPILFMYWPEKVTIFNLLSLEKLLKTVSIL